MIAALWGQLWPNVAADPITALIAVGAAWLFRDRIGRHLVAWWHKHHQAHLAHLAAERERLI